MSGPAPQPLVADVVGDGAAVLLLHGQPGTAADWNAVIPLLADRYTMIAPDRPGYGRTGGAAQGFDGNAAAAFSMLDDLGVDTAVVAGHSWGGGVALRMAELAPDRVSGLVLVASVSPDQPITATDRLLATRPLSELAALAATATSRVLAAPPVWRRIEQRLSVSAGTALAALLRQERPSAVWHSFVVEQRAYVTTSGGLAAGLDTITCPAAVLVGEADHVVTPAGAEALARRLSGATITRIPGAGHLLPHDEPAAVAAAIDAVACAVPPGATGAGRAGLPPG